MHTSGSTPPDPQGNGAHADPARLQRLARKAARHYQVRGGIRGHAPEDLASEAVLAMMEADGCLSDRELLARADAHLRGLYRSCTRHPEETLSEPDRLFDPHHGPMEAVQSEDFFDAQLASLPQRQALVLELGMRQGLSDDAIAATMHASARAVVALRHRALQTLRERMDES